MDHHFPAVIAYVQACMGWVYSPVQLRMGHYLAHHPARHHMLETARGWGKTTAVIEPFALWCLRRRPSMKILIISATADHAKRLVAGIRRLMELPYFRHLRPPNRQPWRNGTQQLDVATCIPETFPSIAAAGVQSMITGGHYDLIIFDDIEIPANSDKLFKREHIHRIIDECYLILNPGGRIVGTGTPQTIHSVYLRFETSPRWAVAKIPALDRHESSTFPERHSNASLAEQRMELASDVWALQMMLDTALRDTTLNPIKVCNIVQEHYPNQTKLRLFVDPSGATGRDECGYAVAGPLGRQVYYEEIGGLMGGPKAGAGSGEDSKRRTVGICQELCDVVDRYKLDEIVCESNLAGFHFFEDELARTLFERRLSARITPTQSKGEKKRRIINTLEPLTEAGRVVVNPITMQDEQTLEQFELFTYDELPPQDDRIDAMSIAADWLGDFLDYTEVYDPADDEVRDPLFDVEDDGGMEYRD